MESCFAKSAVSTLQPNMENVARALLKHIMIKTPFHKWAKMPKSKVEDLKMVCANCHRILHRSIPWMRVDELREAMEQIHSENQ